MSTRITTVITDLDNTLFDWFGTWHSSFSAMLQVLEQEISLSRDRLLPLIKQVHQRYGTAEYTLLLRDLSRVLERDGHTISRNVLRDATEAYQSARKSQLELYQDVHRTLSTVSQQGLKLVGYTESLELYSVHRIKSLGLDGVLEYLYTPPNHALPEGKPHSSVSFFPLHDNLNNTCLKHTPEGVVKPSPMVLESILKDLSSSPSETLYIGDSLVKDISMAQSLGVVDAYAQYGRAHHKGEYELLRKVTHWTDEQVQKEKETKEKDVSPTYVIEESFSEILNFINI